MNRFTLTILSAGLGLALAPAATAGTTIDVPGPLNLTIQEAIDIAESLGATQLNIADGVYAESLRLPDNGYDLVLMGNPANPAAVVIDPSAAFLDDSAIHVLGGQTAATQLIGLTLTGGNADGVDDGDAQPDERGGGLFVSGSDVTISDCVFVNNAAALAGGGFYVNAGTVSFSNCRFEHNLSSGAGVHGGGGVYMFNATTTFTDCAFVENEALSGLGGGMRTSASTDTLIRCTFEGNTASTDGGGIWQSGSLTIVASELVGNDAILGGGLYAAGTVDARDTIINGNIAANTGSGIYAQGGSILTLVNASVVHNTGGNVIFGAGSKTIRSSIVWSNNGGTIGGGNNNNVSYSMVEGGWVGTANINPPAGPGFMDELGSDLTLGTTDDDLTLAAGSPAIDAGDASAAVAGYPADHDGLPRAVDDPDTTDTGLAVLGLVVDMGAHEFQTAPPVVTCPGDIDGDNNVGITDFLQLLSAWGPCP